MAVEFDDTGLKVIGNNVEALRFYDSDRVLRATIYLGADNRLNIGDLAVSTDGTDDGSPSLDLADVPFVTLGGSSLLSAERIIAMGSGLQAVDGGADGNYTVSIKLDGATLAVSASGIKLANGTAQYQVPVTGASPYAPAYAALSAFAGAGLVFSGGVFAVGAGAGITVNADDVALTTPGSLSASSANSASGNHTHTIDSTIARAAVTITAGAGLTGGGDLSSNRTLTVVSGNTGIVVNADDITLTLAATSGLQISSGLMLADTVAGAGLTIASKVLAVGAGAGLTVNADDVALTTPGSLTASSTNSASGNHTHAIDSTIARAAITITAGAGLTGGGDLSANRTLTVGAGAGITVNADDVALTTPGTLSESSSNTASGSHTHAITASSNPGAAASLLKTDAAGGITVQNLGVANRVTSSLIPTLTDAYDLGSSALLWRKGWLSELDAVLFAQQTITLLGGWFIIGKDEGVLPADAASGATTIDFGKAMTVGHFVLFRAAGAVEYMTVGSLVSGTTYNVTRNLDGSGANTWPAGSVFLVLGASGDGRIELNAYDTPRISILRQGATYNVTTEQVRIGDMNGSYGVASELYGIGIGDYSGGNYLRYNTSAGFLLKSADGALAIDSNGAVITVGTTTTNQRAFSFTDGANIIGGIYGDKSADNSEHHVYLKVNSVTGRAASALVSAESPAGKDAQVVISVDEGGASVFKMRLNKTYGYSTFPMRYDSVTTTDPAPYHTILGDATQIEQLDVETSLNIGTATSAATGEARASVGFAARINGSSGGIYAGASSDVQLYRSAADMWRTPDGLTVDLGFNLGSATSAATGEGRASVGWAARVDGSGGGLYAGAASDVQLYRSVADLWRTPDGLTIDLGLNVGSASSAATGEVRASAKLSARIDGSSGGFYGGASSDVQLYRSAADLWRTPDGLTVDLGFNLGSATSAATGEGRASVGWSARVDGSGGGLYAGAGSDVQWYRSAADTWRTPDSLIVDSNLTVSGSIIASTPLGARAYHNANQAITTATQTALALNSERFDTDTIHDTVTNNSRLTCKTAGKYMIVGNIRFANNTTGKRDASIRLNGATMIAIHSVPAGAGSYTTILHVSTLYDLAVNDYVELMAYQDSGGNLNVEVVGNYSPEFSMIRIA